MTHWANLCANSSQSESGIRGFKLERPVMWFKRPKLKKSLASKRRCDSWITIHYRLEFNFLLRRKRHLGTTISHFLFSDGVLRFVFLAYYKYKNPLSTPWTISGSDHTVHWHYLFNYDSLHASIFAKWPTRERLLPWTNPLTVLDLMRLLDSWGPILRKDCLSKRQKDGMGFSEITLSKGVKESVSGECSCAKWQTPWHWYPLLSSEVWHDVIGVGYGHGIVIRDNRFHRRRRHYGRHPLYSPFRKLLT